MTPTPIRLLRPEGLYVSPAFSQVAVVPPGATTIYVGGQNAVDADGTLVGGDDVAAQTHQAVTNVVTALRAAGADVADLVSLFLLLVEGVDPAEGYRAAAPLLAGGGDPPLVTASMVTGLAVPGALVEVAAVAATVA